MGNTSSSSSSGSRGKAPPPSLQQTPTMRFRTIADNFTTLEQVQGALRKEGLESSQLIVAIDFTKSNEWTGRNSFGGKCLHTLTADGAPNPYQSAVSAIGRTLSAFDDDNLIPAYGFGDGRTQDHSVFSFLPGDQPCQGLDTVVQRYRDLVPQVKLAGPTSFAPAIYQAMQIVSASGGQYHILLIVADGQVTRPSDLPRGQLSIQERATINAIVAASQLPLSIIMVGVGDGPWDVMQEFDDMLPARKFDNFQFVNFTDILQKHGRDWQRMEALFALRALMEVPEQYKLIQKMGMLGARRPLQMQPKAPLDPPGAWGPPPGVPAGPYPGAAPYPGQPGVPYMTQGSFQAPPGMPYAPYPGAAPYPYPPQGPPVAFQQVGSFNYAAAQGPAVGIPYPGGPAGAGPGAPGAGPSGAGPSGAGPLTGGAGGSANADSLFICPITQECMRDPVIAADGYTYERSAIEEWLRTHDTSPMTNAHLQHKGLTPNHALRSSILEAEERRNSAAGMKGK